ncbi:hypothetical protein D3C72_1911580 [compost metagenome]
MDIDAALEPVAFICGVVGGARAPRQTDRNVRHGLELLDSQRVANHLVATADDGHESMHEQLLLEQRLGRHAH